MKRSLSLFFILISIHLKAQIPDSTIKQTNFFIDSLGRKQGLRVEKAIMPFLKDSLDCSFLYVNDTLSGRCICKDKNEKIVLRGFYANGKKQAYWTYMGKDPLKHETYVYEQGVMVRIIHASRLSEKDSVMNIETMDYKNKDGRTYQREYYENNKLVKTREYPARHPYRQSQLDNTLNFKGPWTINAGYIFQKNHWLEVGIKKYSHLKDDDAFDIIQPINYILIGAEMMYNRKVVVAPKIGIGHYDFTFCNFNLNCILYNDDFKTFNPALTPEIGISFPVGIVQINYGYNIFFTKDAYGKGNNHRIALHINIPLTSTGK